MKFDEEMTMGQILGMHPDARAVLEGFGMHCCGCPMSQAEALIDACEAHGIDIDLVLEELNNLPDDGCDCGCCCGGHCDCDDDCDCVDDYDYEDDCDCCCGEDCDCDDDCDCGCKD